VSVRLVAASADIKALISRAEQGDRVAALELATTYRCDSVRELLGVLCPLDPPSVALFDVAADAMSLKARRDASRPVLKIK
jgi:hypothetical protein